MDNIIELELKAVDFKDTDFICNKCAIEKAVYRQLGIHKVYESVNSVEINSVYYFHEKYGPSEFNSDKEISEFKNFDNTTIRTITLTEAQ